MSPCCCLDTYLIAIVMDYRAIFSEALVDRSRMNVVLRRRNISGLLRALPMLALRREENDFIPPMHG